LILTLPGVAQLVRSSSGKTLQCPNDQTAFKGETFFANLA